MSTQATQENLEQVLKDPLQFNFEDMMSEEVDEAKPEGKKDEKPSGETSDAAPEEEASEPKQEAELEAKAPEKEPDQVIKTKDGKHEIPYSVLQAEREKNRKMEDQLAELNAKLAAVQAEASGGQQDLSKDVGDIISAEELAALKEDAPQLGAVVEKLVGKIGELTATAEEVRKDKAVDVRNLVQEAIDSIPKLAHVQASDPDTWDRIAEIDIWARSQPQFQSIPLADRFAKVLGMYEAAHGAIDLPESSASGKAKAPTDDAKSKADAKVAAALANAGPNTLSDIPGGQPPAKDAIEEADGLTAAALTHRMMQMTPAELEKYLARFA